MFAAQTRDLYHIESDLTGDYIEFTEGKYIEPSTTQLRFARHIDNIDL